MLFDELQMPKTRKLKSGYTTDADSLQSLFVRTCLLYTSDAADERSSVDLGGRRIIKKKTNTHRWQSLIDDIHTTLTRLTT